MYGICHAHEWYNNKHQTKIGPSYINFMKNEQLTIVFRPYYYDRNAVILGYLVLRHCFNAIEPQKGASQYHAL